ncbi:MAG: hypothetical protein VB071_11925 [Lawsonibacter sp.]|nr:hypothetical protein [Lawsonibacter sp.]
MSWKKWLLPLVCAVMCLINIGQLGIKLSQPEHGSLLGHGLMTLFWLGLTVLSVRGFSAQKKQEDEDKAED